MRSMVTWRRGLEALGRGHPFDVGRDLFVEPCLFLLGTTMGAISLQNEATADKFAALLTTGAIHRRARDVAARARRPRRPRER